MSKGKGSNRRRRIMERTGEGKLEERMGKEGGRDEEGIKEEV